MERRQRAAEVYCKVNRAHKGTHKRTRKKRTAIPVQPPRVPQLPPGPAGSAGPAVQQDEPPPATTLAGSASESESSEPSEVADQYTGPPDSRQRFQKRSFSLKKRLLVPVPVPASMPVAPELHNAHNLNIQLNSADQLFSAKHNSYSTVHDDESSLDVSSPRDNNSPMVSCLRFSLLAFAVASFIFFLFLVWSTAKT